MYKRILYFVVFILASASVGVHAQSNDQKTAAVPFTFRSGQSVYIAGYYNIAQAVIRSSDPAFRSNLISRHPPVEQRVRKELEERRGYKVVEKVSEADFVFLVFIDGNMAEGLVLPLEKYNQYPDKIGIGALREIAYARSVAGPFRINTLGKISDRLVEAFHEKTITGNKKTP